MMSKYKYISKFPLYVFKDSSKLDILNFFCKADEIVSFQVFLTILFAKVVKIGVLQIIKPEIRCIYDKFGKK